MYDFIARENGARVTIAEQYCKQILHKDCKARVDVNANVGIMEPRPFFGRIESLRGIGAMIVAAWHVSGWAINGVLLLPHQPWQQASALQNAIGRFELALLPGHAALMIFFVISGLVLRVSLQYGPQDFGRSALRFHIARIFRIYPVCMFAILIAALAHGWMIPSQPGHPAMPLDLSDFVANLLLLDVSLNGTLWAIQVEVVMAPFIVLLYFIETWQGPRALVAIAVITSFLSFSSRWTPWAPLSHNFFAFVLGMLIPTLGKTYVQQLSRFSTSRLLAGAVISLFLAGPLFGFFSRYSAFVEAYAATILVSILAYRIDLQGFWLLDTRPFRLLGVSSGSYYVLHMSLLVWIVPLVAMVTPAALNVEVPALTGPVVIAIVLGVLSAAAILSYLVVEAPGIALGRRIMSSRRLRLA